LTARNLSKAMTAKGDFQGVSFWSVKPIVVQYSPYFIRKIIEFSEKIADNAVKRIGKIGSSVIMDIS